MKTNEAPSGRKPDVRPEPMVCRLRPDVLVWEWEAANVCVLRNRGGQPWILADTGPEELFEPVLDAVRRQFGNTGAPAYLLLTSGRGGRNGAAGRLALLWDVPVYAAEAELPYLTGRKNYPDGEKPAYIPTARLLTLPKDGALPAMDEWEWLSAPEDAPGRIALFRQRDGVLIAGAALPGGPSKSDAPTGALPNASRRGGSAGEAFGQNHLPREPFARRRSRWDGLTETVARAQAARLFRGLRPRAVVPAGGEPVVGEALDALLRPGPVSEWNAPGSGAAAPRPGETGPA